jgi:hypothetical protein
LTEVQEQVNLACEGIATKVATRQTDTGVKDAYTQHWIDQLIGRAREMKKDSSRTKENITAELMAWVKEHEADIYNPFLTLKGIVSQEYF